jgi:hypothetical protein
MPERRRIISEREAAEELLFCVAALLMQNRKTIVHDRRG